MDREESLKTFRENEAKLDSILKSAEMALTARGISARDASNRQRLNVGHGSDTLSWAYIFDKTWFGASERAFVSVRISYTEPFPMMQPPVLYGAVYSGHGDASNLSARVAAGEIKYSPMPTVPIVALDERNFAELVAGEIESGARALGTQL